MRSTFGQFAAVLALATLTVTACNAGAEDPGTPAGDDDAAAAHLSLGYAAAPANLDFTTTGGAAIVEALLYNVYEGLVKLSEDGEIQPLLAESWEISADGTEYTFQLREGVSFHDGTPFTAEIVEFSLGRLDQWSANAPANLDAISSVEATSDYEVVLTLEEPDYDVLFWLTGPEGAMFAPDSVETLATDANGTGPFTFQTYQNAVELELVRHQDYWGEPAAVETVTWEYFADSSAAANALRTGGVDALIRAEAYDQVPIFEQDENFEVSLGTSQGVVVLSINTDEPPLDDVRVRQAIATAIDKEAVLAAATTGYGTVLGGPAVPTDPYYEDHSQTYSYDPQAAQDLLSEAGVEDLHLSFTVPNRPYAEAAAQVIQDNLAQVGIDASLETQEFPAVWVEQSMGNREFDLTVVNHVEKRNMANYANPDYYWGYDSADAQAAFAEAVSATDDDAYSAAMSAAAEQIVADSPGVWLYNPPNIVIARSGVSGLPVNDLGAGFDLSGVTVND